MHEVVLRDVQRISRPQNHLEPSHGFFELRPQLFPVRFTICVCVARVIEVDHAELVVRVMHGVRVEPLEGMLWVDQQHPSLALHLECHLVRVGVAARHERIHGAAPQSQLGARSEALVCQKGVEPGPVDPLEQVALYLRRPQVRCHRHGVPRVHRSGNVLAKGPGRGGGGCVATAIRVLDPRVLAIGVVAAMACFSLRWSQCASH
mmetsp:Transcript_9151/g.23484  ORF Transcript_9151/g.23484 Transcript_9151/m.23484 type:complete len:205 (-) Transcript_9151:315-929(-)